ncbi:MAG: hypothetical protein JWM68_4686 [Verrucomicrobiales bacterium]|nr:hypothetical protein [Verrucomicrobiales bacterium]
MKTPPLLLAAVLIFWGWQADFLLWSILMATIVESSRVIKVRLNFPDTDLNRIWDLCGLLFAGAFVFLKSSADIHLPAFVFPQWFPFIFYPMILAQVFGTNDSVSMKTYSWLLRWRNAQSEWANHRINFSYIYFAVCVFGASTTNRFGANVMEKSFNWYYPGLAIVVAWALLANRPRRVSFPAWTCILALIVGGGFVAQLSLHGAQSKIETTVGSWIIRFLGKRQLDANESRTAIGRIGRLKLSGRIVLRGEPVDKKSTPDLLREATYVTYKNEIWFGSRAAYSLLTAGKDDSWPLVRKTAGYGVTLHTYLNNGTGILPLPVGTSEITNLPAVVEINSLGNVKVKDAPGMVSYFAHFGPGETADSPPGPADAEENIPEKEKETFEKLVHLLQLDSPEKSPNEKLKIIGRFFGNDFSYSTYISEQNVDRSGVKTPLTLFLEKTHSGHCEYFATATVLLARAAKIPARYAVGYSVQEPGHGNTFIVRERHAHAWALVWNHGTWESFDTTPASWNKIEESNASFFEMFSDAWARFLFEFSKWRYGKTSYQNYLVWALVPLILILVWRIVFNKERKRIQNHGPESAGTIWPGLDSEFYLVEQRLTAMGLGRAPEEALLNWRKRLQDSTPFVDSQLERILILHCRYRFDPKGISTTERKGLSEQVDEWLTKTKAGSSKE